MKCKCVRKKENNYCYHHQPKDNTLPPKEIKISSKQSDTIINDDSLSYEINLLRNYLNNLVSNSPKKITRENLRLQITLIEQIRKLVFSLSNNNYQTKLYDTTIKIINIIISKVVEIINKHVSDDFLKEIISKELINLNLDESENKDLNKLLKEIKPK